MTTRTITGTLYSTTGDPLVGAPVLFSADRGTYTIDPDITYVQGSHKAFTNASGVFSVTVEEGLPVLWNVSLPNGERFQISVPEGDDTTLEALREEFTGGPPAIIRGSQPYARVFNIVDYGAQVDGDLVGGGTNDVAAVVATIAAAQEEIDAGTISGATIHFPEGNTKITLGVGEKITFGSNIHFRQTAGGRIDLTSNPNNSGRDVFRATGSEAASHALSSNASLYGVSVVCASAASYAEGDMVRICSDALFDPSQDEALVGEINFVRSVSGTTINLMQPLTEAYLTADNARISKITPITNVSCVGLHFYGLPGDRDTANSQVNCFMVDQADTVQVSGCTFENFRNGVMLTDVVNWRVVDNAFKHAHSTSQMYAMAVTDACQDGVYANNTIWNVRNALSTNNNLVGGVPRRFLVANNVCINPVPTTVDPTTGDSGNISTHSSVESMFVIGNTIVGSPGNAISMAGRNLVAANNMIYGCAWVNSTPAIYHHNETNRAGYSHIVNNVIEGCGGPGIFVDVGSGGTPSEIEGYRAVLVSGNTAIDCGGTGSAIRVTGNANGTTEQVVVTSNVINSTHGLVVSLVSNALVANNMVKVTTASDHAITIDDSVDVVVNGNVAVLPTSSTGSGFRIDSESAGSCTKVLFGAGNKVVSPSPTSSRGVLIDNDATNIIVGGANDFSQCTTPVSAGTGTTHQLATRTTQNTDIASDAITLSDVNVRSVRVDTESDAATDDLATINGGTAGQVITIRSENSTKDPTLKDGTGNLRLAGDFTLTNSDDTITLISDGTNWREIARSDNA